jgi:hypothetical protein
MIRVCAIVACLLVIAAGLLVIAAGFMTQTQLRADFAKDPATLGWALVDPKPGVKADGAWLKKADGSERNCIACDTGNSPFDVLIERLYPKAEVRLITSVRSSTGCSYYKDDNRVKEYVVDHNPDLLIIAGISHGHDPEPMRSVIRQVREQIDPEVMIMTGAVSPLDWFNNHYVVRSKLPKEKALENVNTFAARAAVVAREEDAEFFHIRRAWDEYIQSCGVDPDFFHRDFIHANARGRQVLARIIESYFAPAYDSGTTVEVTRYLTSCEAPTLR